MGRLRELSKTIRDHFGEICVGLAFFAVIGILVALAAPEWIIVTPLSRRVGLYRSCVGESCTTNTYPATVGCRNGAELKDRMDAAGALMVVELLTIVLFSIFALLAALKVLKLSTGVSFCILVVSFIGAVCGFIAIGIVDSTFDEWLYCDKSFCDVQGPGSNCGKGASFAMAVVGAVGFFLVALGCCIDRCRMGMKEVDSVADGRFKKVITWTVGTVLTLALILITAAVASPRWYEVSWNEHTIGLFRQCIGPSCWAIEYASATFTSLGVPGTPGHCQRSGGALRDRVNTVKAFLFIPFLVYIFGLVVALLRKTEIITQPVKKEFKIAVTVVLWVCFAFLFIALAVFGNTFDSWYHCGTTYCDGYRQFRGITTATCSRGSPFGMALIAIIFSFFLAVIALLEMLGVACFNKTSRTKSSLGTQSSSATFTRKSTEPYAADSKDSKSQGSKYDPEGGSPGPDNSGRSRGGAAPPTQQSAASASRDLDVTRSRLGKPFPPAGDGVWEFDAQSGYYVNEKEKLFWDEVTDAIYDTETRQWCPVASQH